MSKPHFSHIAYLLHGKYTMLSPLSESNETLLTYCVRDDISIPPGVAISIYPSLPTHHTFHIYG